MADEHEVDMPESTQDPEQDSQEQPEATPEGSDDLESPSDQLLSDDEPAGDGAAGEPADENPDKVVNPEDASEEDAEAAMLAMMEGEGEEDSGEPQEEAEEGEGGVDDMMALLDELPTEEGGASADNINFGSASASKAEFQQLQEPAARSGQQSIDMLMDVNLPISIELGRTRMTIQDILALGPGSVVELNKLAGEPVDLLVNYKVVARGEVVVIDENFGVRITQLLTPEERLRALGQD
jgi:flagellar motor switch protein FliN/FliY